MFRCLCTAITAIIAGVSIAAFSSLTLAADAELAELQTMFKEADIIPDGKLDKGEFDMHHLSAFTYMDMNNDGFLD